MNGRTIGAARVPAALVALTALAGTCVAPTRAQTPVHLAVIPFTLPGDDAPYEDAAVSALVARLKAAGATVALARPGDPFALDTEAARLCGDDGADAIVTGRLRVEQTSTAGSLAFVPYIGPLAKALVNTHPSHAVVTLDRIDCSGRVVASSDGIGDDVHHGQNVAAGVTVSVQSAIEHAVAKLIVAPDVPPSGDVWLVAGARPADGARSYPQARDASVQTPPGASGGATFVPAAAERSVDPKRIAFTAVEDPLDPDAHEQFASSSLLRHLGDLGYSVAETAPLDRFEIARLAPQICATTGAGRILATAVRYEQSDIDTLITSSYPTHAFLHFDLLDCAGAVVHSEDVASDVKYGFANVGAAISKALDQGVDVGLGKLGLHGRTTAAR